MYFMSLSFNENWERLYEQKYRKNFEAGYLIYPATGRESGFKHRRDELAVAVVYDEVKSGTAGARG